MVLSENSTKHIDTNDLLELLIEGGLERIGEAVQILINAAMLAERERYLGAAPHQRSETRNGHANGFKDKRVKTRVGELALKVPQTRDSKFYPSALQKGIRSERALRLAVAEMYINGVSTRKVASIVQELGGYNINSAAVSRATAELDGVLEEWRNRDLGAFTYVFLDARYENVREGASIIDNGVLIAVGVNAAGHREIIGVSVELSEAEVHWRKFLLSLQQRGLHGLHLIISDDHAGLRAARRSVFPSVPWQRCQYHLQQNAMKYIPRVEMRTEVFKDIRAIFNSHDRAEAEYYLRKAVEKYAESAPRLSDWMPENLPEAFTVFAFPQSHQIKIRTSNMVERVNREVKRRTSVVSIFPNAASCLRLVTACLMEMTEGWLAVQLPYLASHTAAGTIVLNNQPSLNAVQTKAKYKRRK